MKFNALNSLYGYSLSCRVQRSGSTDYTIEKSLLTRI
jgi:hypothetical protein